MPDDSNVYVCVCVCVCVCVHVCVCVYSIKLEWSEMYCNKIFGTQMA